MLTIIQALYRGGGGMQGMEEGVEVPRPGFSRAWRGLGGRLMERMVCFPFGEKVK